MKTKAKKPARKKQIKKKEIKSVKTKTSEPKELKEKEEILEEIIEPQQPTESLELEGRTSRPINLTLSSGQASQKVWQETPTEESLEQSVKDAPTAPKEQEPEEIYKPNTPQEEKFYDFETGAEIEQRKELMETQTATSSGLIEAPIQTTIRRDMRTVGMIRPAEMHQVPQTTEERQGKIYNTRQSPEKERESKKGPFGETAEETVRKYK
tara:strand:- start:48 stop:677 length:630 start_codon:yes stop_codon:yes gene_type:complete